MEGKGIGQMPPPSHAQFIFSNNLYQILTGPQTIYFIVEVKNMRQYLVYLPTRDSGDSWTLEVKWTVTHCVNIGSFYVDIALITLHSRY